MQKSGKVRENIIFFEQKPYDYSIQQSSVKDEQVLIGGKNMPRTKFPTQVYRVDGKNCFLEVLCDALSIDKVSLNFVYYDKDKPAGQREQGKVKIYMEIFQAATLSGDILSGRIAGLAEKSKKDAVKEGEKYPKPVFTLLGGTAAKNTPNNQAVSRQFRLSPGSVKPYVVEAISGPGVEQPNGLITPNGKPEVAIRVGLEVEKLKELAHALTLVTQIWGFTKFMPVVEPAITTARKRVEEEMQEYAKRNEAANLQSGMDDDGFPTELPY